MARTNTIADDLRSVRATRVGYASYRFRHLDDGQTTIHVVTRRRADTRVRVVVFPEAERLLPWCNRTGVDHAMTGGFFSRQSHKPLGRVWMRGLAMDAEPFGKHWADRRGALHSSGGTLRIAPLCELPHYPVGDLVTAGPILLRSGESQVNHGAHFEGIPETWRGELDDEWTRQRTQRCAIGYDREFIYSVTCDGPVTNSVPAPEADQGLDLAELAEVFLALGATDALNLDGGGGSTLVYGQQLKNRPRAGLHDTGFELGDPMPEGRAIHTALAFLPR